MKFEWKQFKLFVLAFLQVFFTCMNIIFITNKMVLLMFITGFAISFIWSGNIKTVVFGTMKERFTYSLGGSLGVVCGYWVSNFILSLL